MDFDKHRPKSLEGFYSGRRSNRAPIFSDSRSLGKPNPDRQSKSQHLKQVPKVEYRSKHTSTQVNQPPLIGLALSQSKSAPIVRRSRANKSKNKPWSRKRKIVTTVLTIVVVLLGLTGWLGSRMLSSLDKVFHGNIFSDAQALLSQGQLKESSGRVNILVAGNSNGDPGHPGANLTDSIMVLSIDPKNNTAFMISIPRDLWVYIPGLNSYQKINASADALNFSSPGLPSGGMGQLEQIVQTDLGIPIDYYALVNYTAFKDAVNAVGGININIKSPDPRGIYDAYTHLKLSNGNDYLNGQQALDLARARGDGAAGDIYYGLPNSDFTRTMYQREMAVAIAKKATSIGVVSNPLKINSLFSALSKNVQTDLNLQNALSLAHLSKSLNLNTIGSYTYSNSLSGDSNPLIVSYTDPASGQEALIPADGIGNYVGLKGYWQQLVSNNPLTKEDASIQLLNGTNVNGLAANQQKVLQSKGVVNVAIGDASNIYPTSMIVDNSGGKDPATKSLLQHIFSGPVVTSDTSSQEAREAATYNQDTFIVIIGQNFANANPIASSTPSATTGSSN